MAAHMIKIDNVLYDITQRVVQGREANRSEGPMKTNNNLSAPLPTHSPTFTGACLQPWPLGISCVTDPLLGVWTRTPLGRWWLVPRASIQYRPLYIINKDIGPRPGQLRDLKTTSFYLDGLLIKILLHVYGMVGTCWNPLREGI